MGALFQDLKYGLRMLAKNPGFTAVAVLTLALGIGANTAIFSVVSGVLLRKPPVKDPDRVMLVLSIDRTKGWGYGPEHPASALDFLDWRDGNHAFEEMSAADGGNDVSLTGEGKPQHVYGIRVAANYFHLLGVSPALGRTFAAGEDQAGHDQVAILSYGLWQAHFGSDPRLVGKTVKLNGETYTVIGVMPASFRLMSYPAEIWTPLVFKPKQLGPGGRQSRWLYVFGRVKPELTVERAQAEMAGIAGRLEQSYPESDKGWDAALISLQEFQIQYMHIRPALMLLMGTVALVLLIACANIAGLLLARGAARQHEVAVRVALGAGRWRLVRQLLSESVLLAVAGAGLGLLLASWGISLLHAALNYSDYVKAIEFGIDPPVLVYTLALSLVTVLIFGLVPAIQISRPDLQGTLKEGGRSGMAGSRRLRMRRVLVVGEVALALVLLTGAGLMIKSFLEFIGANPGFDPDHLLTAEVTLSGSKYEDPAKEAAFFQQVTERLLDLPGIISATATASLPLAGENGIVPFSIEGQPFARPEDRPEAALYVVGAHYLDTFKIPLLRGRAFTDSDKAGAPPVVLVNEAFAHRLFSRREPIGQHISVEMGQPGKPAWREIIGVVGNVKNYVGQAGYNPQIYVSYLQVPVAGMTLAVRTRSDPSSLASAVRGAVWSVDKDQPLGTVMTMKEVINSRGEAGDRLMAELLGIFAGVALILAAVGIYGIIAYSVTQRTREIGIRVALGAEKRAVLALVVGQGMKLALIGLALGLVAAYPLPRLFGSLFQGFSVQAGWVFVIVPTLVAAVGLLASYVPARRATKVDPMVALRYE